jgi:hypothetical protein
LQSQEAKQPDGDLKHQFWKHAGCIECVQSHIREVVFYGCRGERSEIAFLKFILKKAQVLQKIQIAFVNGSRGDVGNKLANDLSSMKRASENCSVVFLDSWGATPWSCAVASDFSVTDPFVNLQ